MNILFFDTETNGLPKKWGVDPTRNPLNFPEILSIAWATFDQQEKRDVTSEEYHVLARPEIQKWDKYAAEVNGIDRERSLAEGKTFMFVAQRFSAALAKADLVVCHNTGFDIPVTIADYIRHGLDVPVFDKTYCTQIGTVELCKIPFDNTHRSYRSGLQYKWPKLIELYKFLFEKEMEEKYEAHHALGDVLATRDCFLELVLRRWVKLDGFLNETALK